MSAWAAVAVVLLTGLGLVRLVAPRIALAPSLATVPMFGMMATVAWLALLDVVGVRWSPLALLPLPIIALAAGWRGVARLEAAHRADVWLWLAIAVVVTHAALLAAVPSFSWDFRYDWGLKARVFAAAGCHDGAWLSAPSHAFVHPSYPPLWPDLHAVGVVLGCTLETAGAVWHATLAVGLAAACWFLAAPAPRWARTLASAAGAWPMVLSWPSYTGNAEPLVAYLVAAGLVGLLQMDGRARMWTVAASGAALALAKQEGMALGLGLVIAAWAALPRGQAARATSAWAGATGCWQLFLMYHGIHVREYSPSWTRVAHHLSVLVPSVVQAVKPKDLVLLGLWVVVLTVVEGRPAASLRRIVAVWAAAVAGAYLTTNSDLSWHLLSSLDRVMAAPLPAAAAALVGSQRWPSRTPGPADPRAPQVHGGAGKAHS